MPFVFGVNSPAELVQTIKSYTLKEVAKKVTCPTLVVDAAQDHFLPDDGKQLYESLNCSKEDTKFVHNKIGEVEQFQSKEVSKEVSRGVLQKVSR